MSGFTTGKRAGSAETGWISPSAHATGYACFSTTCRLSAYSLAFGPEGAPWLAVGIEHCVHCGDGTTMPQMFAPGEIGKLSL